MATLRGEAVDRPAVSFYELNGLDENPNDADPFNIYSHPSWQPLIELTREKSDRIVMRGASFVTVLPNPIHGLSKEQVFLSNGSRCTVQSVRVGQRILTTRTRRDPDTNTVWTEEPLLKNTEDLAAFLTLPQRDSDDPFQPDSILTAEEQLGDTGIVMLDTPDPLCLAASLFDMAEYTVIALTERTLFHRLLDRFAEALYSKTEIVASALPGRLWRIYGPEYASPPYLPPYLFRDYVSNYIAPMIQAIHRSGGYVRLHSHGNLKALLDEIARLQVDGLDPIEPPPQGDVHLDFVRRRYGKDMVLFGNLEISDLENLPTDQFAAKVNLALEQGTAGNGRGFVLMPSACPLGRILSPLTLKNYERMIELVEAF